MGPDGRVIPATNKKFDLNSARCPLEEYEIVEEKLFLRLGSLLNSSAPRWCQRSQAEKVPGDLAERVLAFPGLCTLHSLFSGEITVWSIQSFGLGPWRQRLRSCRPH